MTKEEAERLKKKKSKMPEWAEAMIVKEEIYNRSHTRVKINGGSWQKC